MRDLDVAFSEFVNEYGPTVLTLAVRLTDTATGQDITQEAFLRAYRALASYGPDRIAALELRPWLVTIARNLVRNEYRRRDRKSTVPLLPADGLTTDDADQAVEAIVLSDEVDRLLAQLSDQQREAVVLRHMVGLPMREVALTMACPEGTAKSHVSRALSRMRTTLASTRAEGAQS